MDDVDPLPSALDLHPDLVGMEPRRAEGLGRLRNLLGEPEWEPSRACAILSGFHPDVSVGAGIAGKAFLPGALEHFGYPGAHVARGDELDLDEAVRSLVARVRRLGLKDVSPRDAVAAAIDAGIGIPWLDSAVSDRVCREHLPPRALKLGPVTDPGAEVPSPRTVGELASIGGRAKAAKMEMRSVYRPMVCRLLGEGKTAKQILGLLEDYHGDNPASPEPPERSTVYKWTREFRSAKPKH